MVSHLLTQNKTPGATNLLAYATKNIKPLQLLEEQYLTEVIVAKRRQTLLQVRTRGKELRLQINEDHRVALQVRLDTRWDFVSEFRNNVGDSRLVLRRVVQTEMVACGEVCDLMGDVEERKPSDSLLADLV